MATATQRARLRRDTNTTSTSLPDATIDDLFDEAGERYTADNAIAAYTRVLVFQQMLAGSIPLVDYRQNNSSENQGDIFDHVEKMIEFWQAKVGSVVRPVSGVAFDLVQGRRGR